MAATPSNMIPLGTPAVPFALPDAVSGKTVSLEDFRDAKAVVIMFICNHCPFVKHLHRGFLDLQKDYLDKGVAILAISSNNVATHPDDSPEKMKEEAARVGYRFPYLYDESQDVAKAYKAACTPDFYVFDGQMKLAYRGQFDDSRPGNDVPVTGKDIRAALDAVLAGKPAPEEQRPSLGCNIKWKAGNEPEYFLTAKG